MRRTRTPGQLLGWLRRTGDLRRWKRWQVTRAKVFLCQPGHSGWSASQLTPHIPDNRCLAVPGPAAGAHVLAYCGKHHAAGGPAAQVAPWRRLPSWAVVATGDKAAGADLVQSHAQRAGSDIVEVDGSHVIMISQPQAVTDHILKAGRAVADLHR